MKEVGDDKSDKGEDSRGGSKRNAGTSRNFPEEQLVARKDSIKDKKEEVGGGKIDGKNGRLRSPFMEKGRKWRYGETKRRKQKGFEACFWKDLTGGGQCREFRGKFL